MKKVVCVLIISLMIPAFAGAAIQNIQASNNTNAGVTISWVTDSDTTGEVHYSEFPDLSGALVADDARGQAFVECTHYVNMSNLKKETTYYFEVVSGGEIDNNNGNYYTFKTMKEPFSIPAPCPIYGFVFQEDGTTPAEGAIVHLWLTHNGVDSYPLSWLISPNGSFVMNPKETRSVNTDDLFSSIDPGDPISLEALYCENYSANNNLVFEGCSQDAGSMILEYSYSTTTTPMTTTTAPTTTPTTAPTTTPTTAPTTTPTTAPTTTTTRPPTTTTIIPLPVYEVNINHPFAELSPREILQFNAITTRDGEVVAGDYKWGVDSSAERGGGSIDENGLYKAGRTAGTDIVTVVSPLWPMAYDKMWGAKKRENLSLLRSFRDGVLAESEVGREYIFMLYNNSLEILIFLIRDPSLTKETKEVIDELLPGIQSLLEGKKMSLSEEKTDHLELLFKHFDKKAFSPQLKRAIKKVRRDLSEGILFEQLGVTGKKRKRMKNEK